MRYIHVNALRPGDVLGSTIYDKKGAVLLKEGSKLSSRIIEALKERGFINILIDDEETKGIIIQRPLKDKLEASILNSLMTIDIEEVCNSAKSLVDDMIEGNIRMTDIEFVKDYDNYTYQHSLSVGYMAAVMGLAAGFNRAEIENLTCAGLLHDIGKIRIDKDIINAPRRLTAEEYAEVQNHPQYGYEMLLKNTNSISATVRVAVLEHHENEDGSGYPRKIEGPALHKFSKIIHICDVFDALTSDRSYRSPIPRVNAIEYITQNKGTLFNEFYASVFEKITPLYPTGSIVEISTNRRAIVISNDVSCLSNPTVRMLGSTVDMKLMELQKLYNRKEA